MEGTLHAVCLLLNYNVFPSGTHAEHETAGRAVDITPAIENQQTFKVIKMIQNRETVLGPPKLATANTLSS
jgi:hypothetical protein